MKREDYVAENKEYQVILAQNVAIILSLDKMQYPYLYKRLTQYNCSLRAKLLVLIDDGVQKGEYQTIEVAGERAKWWFASNRYLVDFEPAKLPRFNQAINLFTAFGLVKKRNSSKQKSIEELQEADYMNLFYMGKRMERRGISISQARATLFYHIPIYDAATLSYAENQAKKWNEAGLPMSAISKNAFIRVFGQEVADNVYFDERIISDDEVELVRTMKSYITNLLHHRGYIYPEEVHGSRRHYKKVWDRAKNDILTETGAICCMPTSEERSRWKLPDSKYIIRRLAIDD